MELRQKKPVVAVIQRIGASGGYYLASASNYIYAHPAAIVGNIGVIALMPEPFPPDEEIATTGPFKGSGSSQVDFLRGSAMSKGGFSVIALPSTARKGTISRIVPHLSEGAGVATTRGDVNFVVTEYGIAELSGKSIYQRVMELAQIAHEIAEGAERDDFANLIRVRVDSERDTHEICGTQFGKRDSRVVSVDGYPLEMAPRGAIIFTLSENRPGMIGRLGTLVAQYGRNIDKMGVKASVTSEVFLENTPATCALGEIGKGTTYLREILSEIRLMTAF